jgi:hypothetical protein
MKRPPPRPVSVLLKELHSRFEERERETARLRAQLDRMTKQRDDLTEQLRFAIEQANRETREASSLRAELLARSTVPEDRLDFCRLGEHGETTAVLPRRMLLARAHAHDEEDTIVGPEP